MQDHGHWRLTIRILFGFGFLLPAVAAYLYASPRDAVIVINGSPIVAEGSRGSDVVLEIPVLNQGEDSVRVLGTKELCLVSGCAKEALDLPIDINGRQSRLIRVIYRIGREDASPYLLTFYTTCVTQPELTVAIRNKCTEPASEDDVIGT